MKKTQFKNSLESGDVFVAMYPQAQKKTKKNSKTGKSFDSYTLQVMFEGQPLYITLTGGQYRSMEGKSMKDKTFEAVEYEKEVAMPDGKKIKRKLVGIREKRDNKAPISKAVLDLYDDESVAPAYTEYIAQVIAGLEKEVPEERIINALKKQVEGISETQVLAIMKQAKKDFDTMMEP